MKIKKLAADKRLYLVSFILIALYIFMPWKISLANPNPNLPGDLNNNNNVDIFDLSILLSDYNTNNAEADINNDALVNIFDLSILLSHYGENYSLTPAAFPSRLSTNGRSLVDENGYNMPLLKGFNAQVVPWSQADFNAMSTLGAKFVRTVVFWDYLEPSQGAISSSYVSALDTHIARLQAAGLYTELEIHLNIPGHFPAWAGTMNMANYIAHGQNATQYLANRYGNPSSPQYTKAVVGFGVNEPPVDNTNDSSVIPHLEGQQRTMISWFRGAGGNAPSWIGFVAYGYAGATPLYNLVCAAENGKQGAYTNADPHAYDSVGGNVIIDLHDYSMGTTTATTNFDGRQFNGQLYPTYQGGTLLGTGSTDPTNYTPSNRALIQSQMSGFVCPYKTFSQQANIPLMVGEWGWTVGSSTTTLQEGTGGANYMDDKMAVWNDAGAIIELQWDYDVTISQDPFVARPNINNVKTWQSITNYWMQH